jgi:hypothetical protein
LIPVVLFNNLTRMSAKSIGALALLLAALVSGCAQVKPWQRGRLSHPCMQLDARMGDTFGPHLASIREGTLGGEVAVGGGCGCN